MEACALFIRIQITPVYVHNVHKTMPQFVGAMESPISTIANSVRICARRSFLILHSMKALVVTKSFLNC